MLMINDDDATGRKKENENEASFSHQPLQE